MAALQIDPVSIVYFNLHAYMTHMQPILMFLHRFLALKQCKPATFNCSDHDNKV